MTTLQQETLKLELGEVYDDFRARTTSYVKGLIAKPWWYSTKQLLQNEGPLGKMVDHCLIYVVEKANRIEGYKAYTSYLTSEYGTSKSHNNKHANLTAAAYTIGSAPLWADTYSEPELVREWNWIKDEELDFMYLIQSVKAREAAEMLDMTVDDVWAKYRNIKTRARRRSPS